jgi:hypothetical protein
MSILGGAIQGIQGAIAYEEAMSEIEKLPQYREYNPISEYANMYGRIDRLSRDPYTASSDSAFNQMLAQGTQSGMRSAQVVDPSVSGAVLSGMNMSGMQQQAGRQMQGEAAKFSYIQMLGNMTQEMQGMVNKNVEEFNMRNFQREVSLRQLAQASRQSAEEGWVETGDQLESYFSQYFSGGTMKADKTGRSTDSSQSFNQQNPYSSGGSGGSGGGSNPAAGMDFGYGSGSGSNPASGMDFGYGGLCWVARAVYGENDPRWEVFRDWLLTEAPAWLRDSYRKHGEAFADVVRSSRVLKSVLKTLMDMVVTPRMSVENIEIA